MLCNLANRMISTLQDLRQLTYSSEKMPVPYDYDPNEGPANIPLDLDAAMGFAVRCVLCARCTCTDSSKQYFVHRKNYRPAKWEHKETDPDCGSVLSAESGRFTRLRWFGEAMRGERLWMDPADVMGGRWLCEAVQNGAQMDELFDFAPSAESALDANADWELVIQLYVSCSRQCDRCASDSCLLVLNGCLCVMLSASAWQCGLCNSLELWSRRRWAPQFVCGS